MSRIRYSSKTPELMQDIVELLKTPSQATDATPDVRVGLYIYVSGSSVYDVCTKKHEGLTKENDAVRPSSADEREEVRVDTERLRGREGEIESGGRERKCRRVEGEREIVGE